jgi:flotillin
LNIAKIEFEKNVELAELQKQKLLENQNYELSIEVEKTRQKQNLEKMRAEKMTDAQVEFEIINKIAEANKYKLKIEAEGLAEKIKTEAEANLHAKKLEAQGIQIQYEAEAKGIQQLIGSFGNDSSAALNYLMINKDMYSKLAEQNAKAIQGLAPKINVWNTGNNSNNDPMSTVRDVFRTIPPMLETIKDQTGIKPPNWLAQLQEDQSIYENKSNTSH